MWFDTMTKNNTTSAKQPPTEDVGYFKDDCESLGKELYLRGAYSDVVLVVDGERLPCHKAVLATRSEYFRALLFGGMKESREKEVKLEVSSVAAFKELLRYIYTGHLCFSDKSEEALLEILGLSHQYGLTSLQDGILEYLKATLSSRNVCQIFHAAKLYQLELLTNVCKSFIDLHAVDIFKQESIYNLSSGELIEIMSSDSLCAREFDIFRTVIKWAKLNKDENWDEVVNCIRFSLLSLDDLLDTVRPEQIVSDTVILDAIAAINRSSGSKLPFRRCLLPNVNVAAPSHGAEVISGEGAEVLLSEYQKRCSYSSYTWHDIGDDQGIVINLATAYAVNCIRLRLYDQENVDYCYRIEVSTDMNSWEKVIDYSNYVCRSWQEVRFATRAVQYVKIVGTWCSSQKTKRFQIITFECMYSDRAVRVGGDLIAPFENVALRAKHARVNQKTFYGDADLLINGRWDEYDSYKGYAGHEIGNGAIVVQLAQPYILDSMRLRLWDIDDRSYRYYVEVSINKKEWTIIADKRAEACKSWQVLQFSRTPVVYIRITGTHATVDTCRCTRTHV